MKRRWEWASIDGEASHSRQRPKPSPSRTSHGSPRCPSSKVGEETPISTASKQGPDLKFWQQDRPQITRGRGPTEQAMQQSSGPKEQLHPDPNRT
ncbi:hypothetical protein ACLOJK_037499 [Asimina triloba]